MFLCLFKLFICVLLILFELFLYIFFKVLCKVLFEFLFLLFLEHLFKLFIKLIGHTYHHSTESETGYPFPSFSIKSSVKLLLVF
jgi:hypothetical protein